MADLVRLWRRADEAGFHWVSVWDHFYTVPFTTRDAPTFEGVASLTALALSTRRVRVGCLMICTPFRHPAVVAKAAVTIDHLSGGRVELGLGAGTLAEEFGDLLGGLPPAGERLDRLEEAVQVVRGLLGGEPTTFSGRYYRVEGAVCAPRPVQRRLPLWIGGGGSRRTPGLAARFADGHNVPFVSPEAFRERGRQLDALCERRGRDPRSLARSVNVGFYVGADARGAERGRAALAGFPPEARAGMLTGTPAEALERLGEYERAGADQVNLSLRPPIDWDALDAFIDTDLPHFRE
jgi:alkanesulfonate monooxygenase SsuD/methylene tetrahydromethanopterin reductase-like flavin-dependent oxidoreductase (luciferase family)